MANSLLKYCGTLFLTKRQLSSALYITGDKAQDTFRVLTPYLDFAERIKNKAELEENIKLRRLNMNVDKIEKYWSFFKSIEDTKNLLDLSRIEVGKQIVDLMKQPEQNSREIDKLKIDAKLIKDDLKNVKDYLYGLEEHAVESVLALPNFLHPKTPHYKEQVIHTFLEKPVFKSDSHINVAENLHLAEIVNSKCYFKNDAALFEMALLDYFDTFLRDNHFTPFSNSDFVRSVVIEGCGTDFTDQSAVFALEDKHDDKNHELSKLHLVGGASLYSFMAYFTKNLVQQTLLPLRCYVLGRKYKPAILEHVNLFSLEQETAVEIFVATLNNGENFVQSFDEVVECVVRLYENLGYHFRLTYVPANKLSKCETLRLAVEMFSNHLQSYVEVANVSQCDDYLSKRLLFTYNENKVRKYCKVISGSLLSVQKVLGCVLENNSGNCEPLLSQLLRSHVPYK